MNENDRVTEIAGRVAAATEGPWEFFSVHDEIVSLETAAGPASVIDAYGEHTPGWLQVEPANAEFIAHAREDIPYLLERLRTAEAERDEVVKEMHSRELHHFESEVELEVLTAELATVKQQRSDNLRAIAARDAVIAEIQELHREKYGYNSHDEPYLICDYDKTHWPCKTQGVLSTAPESVLAARDAEKWREGARTVYSATIDESQAPFEYWADENPYRAGADHDE